MSYQPLKAINSIHEYHLTNGIQDGLVEYFDWALLDVGNYFNVTLGEISPEGHDYSKLRLSSDPNYTNGQVWEGFRKNWVWQSGVNHTPSPMVGDDAVNPGISGIYVNNQFEPSSGVGQYAHYVDYYNGRVIFDSAISTTSKVQVEYSYKWINVVYANNVPWLREIQQNTTEPTSIFYEKDKSSWDIPPEARLQLPAIAIEVVPTRKFKGYQLGGGQFVYTDVLFHCIAEDEITRNKLLDVISLQSDKTISLLDINSISDAGDYPLDYRGKPVSYALQYPDLCDLHNGGKLRLTNVRVQDMSMLGQDIFGGIVRYTTEGVKTNI
tara:strand:- start:60 stop:1031 length:972 start_codon:yes stop_codon:yes gene_type:complete